jgi:DNA-binding Xre family transcriptional regulator
MSAIPDWSKREYQRIASVHREGRQLVTRFEDGACVMVDAERVLPPHTHAVDWGQMTFDPYEIVVPGENGTVEIPWSTIRALTDRAYSAHLAAAAEQQARQIGLRLRELRRARRLTARELAERAGITPQSISRIERGRHDVVFTTLQRILAAMGCSLKDLVTPPSQTSAGVPAEAVQR